MYTPIVHMGIKEKAHRYQSHAITGHFTAYEIIIKHNFIRDCAIYNTQRLENCAKKNLNSLV